MTEASQPMAAPSQPSEDEAARKEAMRKAGADYFDRVLKKARAGKDPFIEPPRPRRKATDAEDLDPDLETVGRVLEGSKLYVISALFIISSSCSLVFAKGAMRGLRTPCIQAFLHMLPALGLLWALVDVAPLTASLAKGMAPSAAVSAVQTVSLFGALLYADVKLVISWVVLCPALLQAALQLHQGRKPQPPQLALIGVGLIGLLVGSLLGERPGVLGMLNLLVWAAGQAGSLAWSVVKGDRDMAASILGESRVEVAMSMAQEEAKIKAGSLEFYRMALPAGSILVLGFLCLEGKEVVHHELSVPDVTQLLLSVACWATARATGALLADLPGVPSRESLEPFWGVGALVAIAVLGRMTVGWGMLAAVLAIGSGVGMQLLDLYERHQWHVPSVV